MGVVLSVFNYRCERQLCLTVYSFIDNCLNHIIKLIAAFNYHSKQITHVLVYFHFLDNNCYAFDKAKIEKNNFGFGFITGMTQKLSDHFFIEYNIGIGVRIINTTPDWQMDTTKSFFKGTFVSLELPNEDRVGDHDVNIYIPFGIRVCYQF